MSLFSALKRAIGGNPPDGPVDILYTAIIAEARRPDWYVAGAVPDTLDGRFDMMALVMSQVLLRFEAETSPQAAQLSADLTDRFISDMDGNLREDGIGDQVVGKHLGRMMAALGGRLGAYRDAGADDAELGRALARNIWPGQPVNEDAQAWAVAQSRQLASRLAAMPFAALASGRWPQ